MMNVVPNLIFMVEIVIATYFVRNTDLVMRSGGAPPRVGYLF